MFPFRELWPFEKDGDKAVCDCGDVLNLPKDGGTSTLSKHLISAKHKLAMDKKDVGPSAPKKPKMESITTLFSPGYSKQQSQELTSDVTDFIVDNNLPFSIAESPFFRRLVKKNYGQAK
uniref:BED-type domain-containing protein n=1 Tax=Ditylenchus dipsaci TaxID=166011 RepID=A0A915DDZ8_9BILA